MMKKVTSFIAFFAAFLASQTLADQFAKNLALQTRLTPQTLATLYSYGVTVETELRLEYFFYTNSEDKAAALHRALAALGYSGEFGPAAHDASLFIVTGWSVPVQMSEEAAVSWTESMSRIGFEHDAEFDGWGTNPQQ